jgi:hypothetical protein
MSKFRNLLKVGLVLALCFAFAGIGNANACENARRAASLARINCRSVQLSGRFALGSLPECVAAREAEERAERICSRH